MNNITIEYSQRVLSEVIGRAVVEGNLTLDAVACANFLIKEASDKKALEKELSELKEMYKDLKK